MLAFMSQSCANMGSGPSGGYADSIPPSMLESNPKYGAVNFSGNKVTLTFDEYITLSNAAKKVVVSPTQTIPPIVKGIGKKVTVELKDSMIPNTTYSINFGNAIVDNNESNPIEDFYFSFSTGPVLDTMSIYGTVLDARTLAPMKEVYVGVYSNLSDTIFGKEKMERIALTDADGKFAMYNLQAKPYRLYALADANANSYFDVPTEAIAFQMESLQPAMSEKVVVDTFYTDSMTISKIENRVCRRYYPDSIVLMMFNEEVKQQLFVKHERKEADKLHVYFKNYNKLMPTLNPLNFSNKDWSVVEPSVTKDTILYWVKDTLLAKMDTLLFTMDYQKFDSLGELVPAQDTLAFTYINPAKKTTRRRKKQEARTFLAVESFVSLLEWNEAPILRWVKPVESFGNGQFKIQEKQDTIWVDVEASVSPVENSGNRAFKFDMKIDPEKRYRLLIDSAMVNSASGLHNDKEEWPFRRKGDDDYVKLVLHTKNAPANAVVEATVRNNTKQTVKLNANGDAVFEKLSPATYIVRMFEDRNGDGKWTTGNYAEKRVPEQVYYYSKPLVLKQGWDQEEDWDVTEKPFTEQAPKVEKKKKR